MMKTISIIKIAIAVYLLGLLGVFFGAKLYVDKKDRRLYSEAFDNLKIFFSKQDKFVNIVYSGKKVTYEQVPIPEFQGSGNVTQINSEDYDLKALDALESARYESQIESEARAEWQEKYGDINKLYRFKPKGELDGQWSGWMLDVIERLNDGFFMYQVYPYQVGYIRQKDSWMYNYAPSVQEAVDEAFEFHSENMESGYLEFITNNGGDMRDKRRVWNFDVKKAVDNEYYHLFSYDELVERRGTRYADSLLLNTRRGKFDNGGFMRANQQYSRDYGYMYNGYYKVYNRVVPLYYYHIKYNAYWDPKTRDRNVFRLWGTIILTIVFLSCIIPLSVIESNRRKIKLESLKNKLVRLCDPKNYMKPYDKEKITKANLLYSKLLSIDAQDES